MSNEMVAAAEFQQELLHCLLAEVPADDEASRHKRYGEVIVTFSEDYFSDDLKRIFIIITRFYKITGQAINLQQFEQLLQTQQGVDEGIKLVLCNLFVKLSAGEVPYAHFAHCCQLLKEITRRDLLGNAVLDAGEILINGMKQGRTTLFGYEAARNFLQDSIAKVDAMNMGVMPEGNINIETKDILCEYADRKNKKASQYPIGLAPVDQCTGGIQPGELWYIAGYTEEGKTSLVVNIAYHLVYVAGLNVAFGTNETLRRQVRLKIVCRHSASPKFSGILPYDKLKTGQLTEEQEAVLQDVVADMRDCPDYGRLELFQLPFKATVGYVEAKLRRYQQRGVLHCAIIDELRLLGSGKHRTTAREELDDIIRGCKQLATSFGGGKGIALICPYQVSREAWKEALQTGKYTKACMSNTSEAERTADAIITILRLDQATRGQIVKYRDAGEQSNVEFNYDVRAEVCLFQALRQEAESDWLA